MDEPLLAAMDRYQENVFEYSTADLADSFIAVVNAIGHWVNESLQGEDREFLNRLLETMLAAYQNQDYLLVADLMEYELKPLVIKSRK